jgi:hypothetical protein
VTDATPDRPVFVIRLRARPGVNSILALRQVLRRLLRNHGLVCVGIEVEPALEVPAVRGHAIEPGELGQA